MNIQEIEFVSSTKRVHRVSVFAKGASLGNCLSAENRILTNKSRNAFSALKEDVTRNGSTTTVRG